MMKKVFYKWLLRSIGSKLPDPGEWGGYFRLCHKIRNRWARKIAPGISKDANICRGARISGDGDHLVVEPYGAIGINCLVGSEVFIGEHTMMGPNVSIISGNHKLDLEKDRFDGDEKKPVYIGHHSWIGRNAIILPGAKIGHHCTIGAGAVVPGKEFPDYALIAGNPALVKKIYKTEG